MPNLAPLPTHAFTPERERTMIGVLYDPATGAIAHVHMASVEDGAALPDHAAFEKEALEHLTRYVDKGKPRAVKLSFLHVDPQHYRAGARYVVDTKTHALTEALHKT